MTTLAEAEAKRRTEPMEGAAISRNIWSLHDGFKETRQIAREAQEEARELKGQVAMLQQQVQALQATASAAMAMAQGGGSTSGH